MTHLHLRPLQLHVLYMFEPGSRVHVLNKNSRVLLVDLLNCANIGNTTTTKPVNQNCSIEPCPTLAILWLIKLCEQWDSYDQASIKLAVLASKEETNIICFIDLQTYLNALSLLLSDNVKKKKNPRRCQRSSSSSLANS